MDAKKRLFIAFDLDAAVLAKARECVARMKAAHEGQRLKAAWVRESNLHVTLRFLGATGVALLPALERELKAVAAKHAPIALRARRAGAFPSEARARVLWLGIDEPTGALAALANELEAKMRALGFEPEAREYKPHLTIARIKQPGRAAALLDACRDADFGESVVRELVLFESRIEPAGSVYTPIFKTPLVP